MFSKEFAFNVEELGVRSFQGPGELCTIAFAGVDLVALRMDLEKELLVGGWLELLRDLLGGSEERKDAS
jgi:hypothetical protein